LTGELGSLVEATRSLPSGVQRHRDGDVSAPEQVFSRIA